MNLLPLIFEDYKLIVETTSRASYPFRFDLEKGRRNDPKSYVY